MKLIIDTDKKELIYETDEKKHTLSLYSREAFELISHGWLKIGWSQKYSYSFSWLGRPIIQMPEDIIRIQEVIYSVKPDVIIETGIAHGGSLIFYAGLCKAMGKGKVIGIDIEIRPQNRDAIQLHELYGLITLIEGSSTDPKTIRQVEDILKPNETVLVVLDSCHTKNHVYHELESYAKFVAAGSYIIATDGVMKYFHDVPEGKTEWAIDNPVNAIEEFVQRHDEFEIVQPVWLFNESNLCKNVTYWPQAYLKRKG